MADLENDGEAQLLIQLALSMLTDEDCSALLGDLDHPDPDAQYLIAERLERIRRPDAE